MKIVDELLNKITMYRLTLYYLIALISVAVVLSIFKILSVTYIGILFNTLIAIVFGYLANYIFAKIFRANTNVESVFITGLILVLIVPPRFPQTGLFMIGATVAAMASKYFLTVDRQHLFNPAAVAVAGIALLSPEHAATWWVGTPYLAPFVFLGGLLIVRKIHRGQMVWSFLITYTVLITYASFMRNNNLNIFQNWSEGIAPILKTWQTSFTRTALFFFTFVMLTEPITAPGRKYLQNLYSVLIAALYATPQLRLFSPGLTPEQALVLGNVLSHFSSPKSRMALPLVKKIQLTADTFAFVFKPVEKFAFTAGQYLEWTLPHPGADARGNRRYFSLASSPTEEDIMITVKFYNPSSTYKKALFNMPVGEEITASQLSGDFVLPQNSQQKLVFIAGGVGVVPFRSIIKYLIDKKIMADIFMFYSNNHKEDIIYADLFSQAQENGLKTIYTLTDKTKIPQDWEGKVGFVTPEMITETVTDFKERTFYISGPQLMVQKFEEMLGKMKVPGKQVIVDYFPGYAEK